MEALGAGHIFQIEYFKIFQIIEFLPQHLVSHLISFVSHHAIYCKKGDGTWDKEKAQLWIQGERYYYE